MPAGPRRRAAGSGGADRAAPPGMRTGTSAWPGMARIWTACWRTAVRHSASPVAARPPGGSCRIRAARQLPGLLHPVPDDGAGERPGPGRASWWRCPPRSCRRSGHAGQAGAWRGTAGWCRRGRRRRAARDRDDRAGHRHSSAAFSAPRRKSRTWLRSAYKGRSASRPARSGSSGTRASQGYLSKNRTQASPARRHDQGRLSSCLTPAGLPCRPRSGSKRDGYDDNTSAPGNGWPKADV